MLLLPGDRVSELVIAAVLIPLSGRRLLSRQSPRGAGPQPGPLSGPLPAAIGGVGPPADRLRTVPLRGGASHPHRHPRNLCRRGGRLPGSLHHSSRAGGCPIGAWASLLAPAGRSSYPGTRLQPHLPELVTRRLLALLVLAVGVRYAWLAATRDKFRGAANVTITAVHPSPGGFNGRAPQAGDALCYTRVGGTGRASRATHSRLRGATAGPRRSPRGRIWTLTHPDTYQSIKEAYQASTHLGALSTRTWAGVDRRLDSARRGTGTDDTGGR